MQFGLGRKLLKLGKKKELKKFEGTKFKPTKSSNPRMISKRLRNSVLKTANYKRQFPGCETDHYLQIDHITPVKKTRL
jgi:hypothetical protein